MPTTTRTMQDADFAAIRGALYQRTSIFLPESVRLTAERTLAPRLDTLGLESFDAYARYLTVGHIQADELAEILDRLGITESSFFRDLPQLEHFDRTILPALITTRAAHRRLRLWSAGCASGEEPHTLAILIHRALGVRLADWHIEIVGTDLSDKALSRAREGCYPTSALRTVSPALQSRYFSRASTKWALDPEVRAMVSFVPMNLRNGLAARRMGRFDAIFCRNTLHILDAATRADILQTFRSTLADDGALFLSPEDVRDTPAFEGFHPLDHPQAWAFARSPDDPFRFSASA